MLPGAGVAFPMVQTCSNKVGVGRRFFLCGILGTFSDASISSMRCLEDTGIIVILLNSNSFLNDVQMWFWLAVIGHE